MLADYFSLQLEFAAHYASEAKMPLHLAIVHCTNLRRRLNLGGPAGAERWDAFLTRVRRSASDRSAVLSTCMDFHHDRPASVREGSFGCFAYDPPDAAGVLRVHFMPPEHMDMSPLASACTHARAQELRQMFSHIRCTEHRARSVLGISWLYNLESYKRLFPERYVASIRSPWFPLNLNGSSTWGQVLDWRQQIKPTVRADLLARLPRMKIEAPWKVFPLQALVAAGDIQPFYEVSA